MEDQQADPGDLTAEDDATAMRPRKRGIFRRRTIPESRETLTPAQADKPDQQPADQLQRPVGKAARVAKAEAAQPDSQDAADVDVDETPAEETPAAAPAEAATLIAHRPAGNRLLVAAAVASVLFVGAGAFAGAMAQPYLAERALVETKLNIARTATGAISTLWTYTPDDMNTLADRAARYLGGDFANEYRKYIDAIVEPNKQAQVTNTTEVMGAAVESVAPLGIPSEATAIVYTNSVATSPVTKNIPSLRYLSYRLTMQRHGSQWLITRMSTVTSFDLTPQL